MIAAVLRWLNRLWDRVEGPISDDDKAKIAAWQSERRERQANLTFTPEAEADVGNPDHRPTADHEPPRDEHEPPPAGGALPDSPPRSGKHAAPLIDPDCRGGKHRSCTGGPCQCDCHDVSSLESRCMQIEAMCRRHRARLIVALAIVRADMTEVTA